MIPVGSTAPTPKTNSRRYKASSWQQHPSAFIRHPPAQANDDGSRSKSTAPHHSQLRVFRGLTPTNHESTEGVLTPADYNRDRSLSTPSHRDLTSSRVNGGRGPYERAPELRSLIHYRNAFQFSSKACLSYTMDGGLEFVLLRACSSFM